MYRILLATLSGLLCITQVHAQETSPANDDPPSLTPPAAENQVRQTVVETTVGNGTFRTFVDAVDAAGLADDLAGDGPWTVFAPTDEAFEALPKDYVDSLLTPVMHDELVALISYHVVPGKLDSRDLAAMVDGIGLQTATIPTVGGKTLLVDNQVGITVDGATIVEPDLDSTNGIVHGIDTVLLPDAS